MIGLKGWNLSSGGVSSGRAFYQRVDMENVMSGGGSAASVKFQSWGKFLALNICCFVVNRLFVVVYAVIS